ncbi:potassium channel subfamily K member 13 [Xyrauchen texanus]|uniref:potassium channel subfamily K member 13 n=1 Tax=Xyrauchen texanus TaxID=154827 RepID=UPI002241BBDD|nr:potassium channel subfamily K member 13 [Xyrauchen texanus]
MLQSDNSSRTRHVCGSFWSHINFYVARIFLLLLVIVLYTLFGAAVFSALERPSELEANFKWNRQLAEFVQDHQIPSEELRELLGHYEEAIAAGIRMEPQRTRWDFSGAFYFVATVVSTIGFGMTAPATLNGKLFLIFYGLIGCATTNLFFNLFLERMITLITFLTRMCFKHKQLNKILIASHLNTEPGDIDGHENWKPSVYYVTLILAALAFLINCFASGLYSAMEDWSYLESMYFCFVTFSTMGFGDMVSGQKAHYEDRWVYQIANSLAILLGVSFTYSVFILTSILIKQMLNLILAKLCSLCHSSYQDGEDEPCCYSITGLEVKEPVNQQIQNTTRHHSHVVKASLPSMSKCKCASAAIEAICNSGMQCTVNSNPIHGCSGGASLQIRDLDKWSKNDIKKKVFSAKHVAIKNVRKPGYSKPLVTEVALMLMLRHCPRSRNIVQLLEWFDQPQRFILILEYSHPCQSLSGCIGYRVQQSEITACGLMRQAILAVRQCINSCVFHNDIHSDNYRSSQYRGELVICETITECGNLHVLTLIQYFAYMSTRFPPI